MININEITINELGVMLRNNSLSVKELVQEYINCINNLDKGKNGLNSVIEINPDVLEIAKGLDELGYKSSNSKLYGVPILLKDNINTFDRMHTSAGSLALANSCVSSDANVVKILREKGAVILGKTNMTEFANYMTKGMPSGYSSRGKQVNSPYDKAKSPSGSSSGSGVAVTANLCVASIGTDTSGSIISPAMKNSIVGFRPSIGSISQEGIIPVSFTLDTAGPMTRTVDDTIILFSELTHKPLIIENMIDVKGITVGIIQSEFANMTDEEVKKSEEIIIKLERAGTIIKKIELPPIGKDSLKKIQKYEFKYSLNRYLSKLPSEFSIRSLKDIIRYNDSNKDQTLKYGQTLLIDAEDNTSGNLNESIYIEQLKDREESIKRLHGLLENIDICILFKESLVAQYTGLPVITIPCGLYNDGMPFGFSLIARTNSGLLKHARSIEKMVGHRAEPRYKGF